MKKKIIIIDDNADWIKDFKKLCNEMGIKSYPPQDNETIYTLRSLFCVSLEESSLQEEAEKELRTIIEKEIGTNEVVFILDYELFEGSKEITGINFYKKFCNNKPAIFASGTYDPRDIDKIQRFCNDTPNCMFISKREKNWEELLKSALEKQF